jgi:mRNA-decapping enzyme 1B
MSASDLRRTSNLRVLQRLDSQIVDLAISSTHVVLYQFHTQSSTWNKTDIEGPLFIVKRSCSPRFKLIIMNRNSQENLEVGVNGGMEMQLREPYLIFRDNSSNTTANNSSNTTTTAAAAGDETIRGLWFHNDNERKSVHTYLENVVKSLSKIEEMERNAFVPPALAAGNSGAGGNDDNGGGSEKKQQQQTNAKVPEVNTNAAGAALLSTLTLNSSSERQQKNSSQKKQQQQQQQPAVAAKAASSATNTNTGSNNTSSNANALDKKSLQLALLSLIQEDRFLDLLHAQYLKVVRAHQQQKSKSNEEEK